MMPDTRDKVKVKTVDEFIPEQKHLPGNMKRLTVTDQTDYYPSSSFFWFAQALAWKHNRLYTNQFGNHFFHIIHLTLVKSKWIC